MGSQSPISQHAQTRRRASQNQNDGNSSCNNVSADSGGEGRFNSLARQTSIYSLTLDEFQNAMPEPGKNFGSMNMDEFLKNIWTAEESQAMASAMAGAGGTATGSSAEGNVVGNGGGLARQSSLVRQSSLSLPRTLSSKTVDEVWRDIHKSGLSSEEKDRTVGSGDAHQTPRQQTLGKMTLEDFLVKAGVVREEEQETYGLFSGFSGSSNGANGGTEHGGAGEREDGTGPGSLAPTLSLSPANALPSRAPLDAIAPIDAYKQGSVKQQAPHQQAHQADWLRNIHHQQQAQQQQQQQKNFQARAQAEAAAAYGNAMSKRVGSAGMVPSLASNGGYAGMASALAPGLGPMAVPGALGIGLGGGTMGLGLAPGSPVSPVSDGVGHGNGLTLSPVGNYCAEGAMRGRKRGADGPVEKVVERRQRRMIKNRESAARSRARKQAYTVELEAEVTQLKEENSRLRQQQNEESFKRRRMILDNIRSGEDKKRRSLRRTKTLSW